MTQALGLRQISSALAHHAAGCLPAHRAAWAEAMRFEVDSLEDDVTAFRWAVGCVVASYSERINPMRAAYFWPLIGVVAMSVFVSGGYVFIGGNLWVILDSLPALLMIVVSSACAATTILTTTGGRGMFRSLGLALQGRRFRQEDYRELGTVLIDILKGKASPLTGRAYPVLYNADVARLIGDAQALAGPGQIGAEQLGAILQSRIDVMAGDQRRAVRVLRTLGQCLLWFGAIAMVLGAQKALISVTELPERIGGMLAHASTSLVLGFLLAGGIVQPLARRLEAAIADDAHLYQVIRMAFYCRAAGSDADLAVRTAYGLLPADFGMDNIDLKAAAQPA